MCLILFILLRNGKSEFSPNKYRYRSIEGMYITLNKDKNLRENEEDTDFAIKCAKLT